MKIEQTIDMELVRLVVTEPDIWERAADDGMDKDSWYPGTDEMTAWLLCIEDADIVGVILLHTDNSVSIKMHPYLRAKYRQKGRVMMEAFYQWFIESTDTLKINVTIPEHQKKVINFAKKVGFQKEGVIRDSYLKDGKLSGQQNLGITRPEIEGYLSEHSQGYR